MAESTREVIEWVNGGTGGWVTVAEKADKWLIDGQRDEGWRDKVGRTDLLIYIFSFCS